MLSLSRRRIALRSIVLSAVLCGTAAAGADIKKYKSDEGADFITIIGDIKSGDAQRFRAEAATTEDAIVLLESDGGLVKEAIEIGEVIRLKGFATGVINNSACNSSCGLIWLAGSPRGLSKSGRVGFHAAYSQSGSGIAESGVANAIVGRYLTLLNLPEKVVIFATSSPPDGMNWITAENYRQVGIDLTLLDDYHSGKSQPDAEEQNQGEVSVWANLKTFGVFVDHTLDNRCFIGVVYPDGTNLRIGYSGVADNPFYFVLNNDKWTSVREDTEYKLEILFDSDAWDMPVKAMKWGPRMALTGIFSDASFWTDMAKAKVLHVKRGSTTVIRANLLGSLNAIESLVACQKSQNAAYAKDPFASP